jgi:glutamyl endopeptidase
MKTKLVPNGSSVGELEQPLSLTNPDLASGADTELEEVEGLQDQQNADTETSNQAGTESDEMPVLEESGSAVLDDEPVLDAYFGAFPEELARREALEIILGADNRIRITNTTEYPWRAICALKITAANGRQFIGTGFLVGPRTVITAGHCVHMAAQGGWVRSIQVIPGRNDGQSPFGSAVSTVFRSVTGWTQNQNRQNDYGAIILPANARLGDRVGTFGFAVRDDNFLKSAVLNLSGYPGDKGGNQQWFMAQKAKSVSTRVITYEIDTMGGQSGAPVWVKIGNTRFAVGIHTNGHSSGNSATRIVQAVFNNLQNWKAQGA